MPTKRNQALIYRKVPPFLRKIGSQAAPGYAWPRITAFIHCRGNQAPDSGDLLMATSIFDADVQTALDQARTPPGTLFPSPEDWRDTPIYFLMVDRFNNPTA